jgi:hypothetical protein
MRLGLPGETINPLHAVNKAEQHAAHAVWCKQPLQAANVVVARLFIQQVRASQMRLATLERQQPAQAAHMRRGERQLGGGGDAANQPANPASYHGCRW